VLWDRGRGGGYLSLFMTDNDPERVNFTNPAQLRRFKIDIIKYRSHPAGQKTTFLRGIIGKVRQ
jgi:hypothetical protein